MPTPTYNLIQEITVSGSTTTSVSFTSIPTTYDDLVFIVKAKNLLDEAIIMRMNSDSGTNYLYGEFRAATGVVGQGVARSQTSINLTINSTETADCHIWGTIHQYNNSNWIKKGTHLQFNPSSSTTYYALQGGFSWNSTATISTLTFLTSAGTNFVANSIFQLYGIKGSN